MNPKLGRPECPPKIDEAELSEVPDLVQPLEAWRVWKISILPFKHQRIPLLRSVILDTPWTPRQAASAEHSDELGAKCRGLLRASCSCGIYAFKEVGDAFTYLLSVRNRWLGVSVDIAVGSVSLWGQVIECERGYRAQFAYPGHLYLPATAYRQGLEVRSAFGIPVGVYAMQWGREVGSSGFVERDVLWNKTPGLKKTRVLEMQNPMYRIDFYDQQAFGKRSSASV